MNHGLVKKKKNQFVELENDVKAILGINGIIWVYYSTVKVENEYFTDDKTKINTLDKAEVINANSARLIVLFKNIISSLDEHLMDITHSTIMQYYKLYQKTIDDSIMAEGDKKQGKGKEIDKDKDIIKSAFILKEIDEHIIKQMQDEKRKLQQKHNEKELKEAEKVIEMINSNMNDDDGN